MRYGRALKILRAFRGVSQKDLAKKSSLTSSYVSLVEAERRQPSSTSIQRLAKALSVPVFLLTLLAAEEAELEGIVPRDAEFIGKSLLGLLRDAEGDGAE